MPDDIENANYYFNEIDEDNLSKYANALGNLALYDTNYPDLPSDFSERKKINL